MLVVEVEDLSSTVTHGWEVAEMVVRRAMSGAVVAVLAEPIAESTGWFGRRYRAK